MDFNAAIFDLDGTILDSMDVWEHIDIQFLKKRNLPVPENYVTEYVQGVLRKPHNIPLIFLDCRKR